MLLKEVMRRTGLTRRQLRYLEERGLLGFVARSDDRRIFSDRQATMLETLARLRELGASLEEAASLADERLGGSASVADVRLDELLGRALADNERRARVAMDLGEIRRRRRGSAA